ncbi:MAG: hypothetical protein V5A68_05225 [Candidatus Thermoplasmatota archaeon]
MLFTIASISVSGISDEKGDIFYTSYATGGNANWGLIVVVNHI